MSSTPLGSFPSSSTTKSAQLAYSSPEIFAVKSSPAEKMAQSPHNPPPSTSTETTPLFAPQFMSPPSIQAMANTILQNPFLNSAFNPVAAFASPPDIARVQQWFQQNSPYTSPTPSSTPSLISNLSDLSIFSTDSSFALNSQQLNNKFIRADEPLDPHKDAQQFLTFFLEAVKNSDQVNRNPGHSTKPAEELSSDWMEEVFVKCLKSLKVFAFAIAKRKITTELNQRDFRELIKILIDHLTLLKDQRSLNYTLEVLDALVGQQQFDLAISERKSPVLPVFVGLLQRIAPLAFDGNEQCRRALQSALDITYRCLGLVKDKSGARTEHFFNIMLSILQMNGKPMLKFLSLGILRCLIHGEQKWKQFIFDHQIIQLLLGNMVGNRKSLFGQTLKFFNTFLASEDRRFAEGFVNYGGINVLMKTLKSLTHYSEEDIIKPLHCLRLVSDVSAIATQNLSMAINFAISCTFPWRESKLLVYWTNILNALGFLRNAIVLNEQARDYLASKDEGRAVQHFADLSRQCMHEIDAGDEMADKINRLRRSMLDDCLMILAVLCKEMPNGGHLSDGQKNVAKIIGNNETVMLIYQAILRMNTASVFTLQKTVLMSLNRITKSGVLPAVFARGPRLSETLLNFLSSRFDTTDACELNLMKICAEVLHRLIVAADRNNLDVIVTSMRSRDGFRPFELLHSFTNGGKLDSDLYLAMLKIIFELCKREPVLKSQWSNVENVQFLTSNSAISNNPEIVRLCSEVNDMLHMGEDQLGDSLFCDIFRDQ